MRASSRRPPFPRTAGIALVIVLAFLVLITVLIVAFIGTVGVETQVSKSYDDGVAARELVNSATQLVLGQLSDGTKSLKIPRAPGEAGAVPKGGRIAWASQPGAIRTWDDAGRGWKLFKLYSARQMVVDMSAGGYSTAGNLANDNGLRRRHRATQRVGAGTRRDGDDRRRAARAWKRDRQRDRHQDGKQKRPEQRLGLAHELAHARKRQLDERMPRAATVNRSRVTRHADASPSTP